MAVMTSMNFEVVMPPIGSDGVVIIDNIHAIRAAVVFRGAAGVLAEQDWDVPGVYVLVGRVADTGEWQAYVGKTSKLLTRIKQHDNADFDWCRALLVKRDTLDGFNTAETGCLEGLLYDRLEQAHDVLLVNRHRPRDDSLPPRKREALSALVSPVERVLFLIGYDLSVEQRSGRSPLDDPLEEETGASTPTVRPGRGVRKVKLLDLVSSGWLPSGTILVSRFKQNTPEQFAGDGKVEVEPDGKLTVPGRGSGYSPSRAQYVSLQHSEDERKLSGGWYLWQLDGSSDRLSDVRFRYLAELWTQNDPTPREHLAFYWQAVWCRPISNFLDDVTPREEWDTPSAGWRAAHPDEAQTVKKWHQWLSDWSGQAAMPPATLSAGDNDEPGSVVLDREYWVTVASTPEIVALMDELLSLIQETDASASLNYQRRHVGLISNGRSTLYVCFSPAKDRLRMSIRLPQDARYDSLLEGAGLGHKYSGRYGYQITGLRPGLPEQIRSVLAEMCGDAYRLYKEMGGRWPGT